MSIEKLKHQLVPYTMHSNFVLQNLKDIAALGMWCYLSSLPEEWIVNREHLMKHFGIGRDKLKKIFKLLEDNFLIEYVQERNEKNQFTDKLMIVKNGLDFEAHFQQKPLLNAACSRRTEKPSDGKAVGREIRTHINNINNNKINNNKNSCSSSDERKKFDQIFEEKFWKPWPKKVGKHNAKTKYIKLIKKNAELIDIIYDAVLSHTKKVFENRDYQHIPYPAKWLNAESWNDELDNDIKNNSAKNTYEETCNHCVALSKHCGFCENQRNCYQCKLEGFYSHEAA